MVYDIDAIKRRNSIADVVGNRGVELRRSGPLRHQMPIWIKKSLMDIGSSCQEPGASYTTPTVGFSVASKGWQLPGRARN